ncbi:MAG: radical SAM protein [Nitrospinae bacterium]|nr:radical SAM protein [Nitrospinota bacterium]
MNRYLMLSSHCSLKRLEKPYIYDIKNDELYEIDDKAEDFIKRCDDTQKGRGARGEGQGAGEEEFVNFCLKENLLQIVENSHSSLVPRPSPLAPRQSPIPSLRYLELQLTARCNLSCRHCYLGKPKNIELNFDSVRKILKEFEDIQGLRLIISGGEPMLYSNFWEFNNILPDYNFRKVLLTSGWFLAKEEALKLNVNEVQVSLDGLENGHDTLRGKGSFKRAITAMEFVRESGIDLSIATMVHPYNLNDFPKMADLLNSYNVREWGIDVPLQTGNLKSAKDFIVSPEKGGEYLKFAYGGSYHGGSEGYVCGRHICTIMPSGKVCKCGFYEDRPLGNIEEGLRNCWKKNYHMPLKDLQCHDCIYIEKCQGGCRFRAETPTSPDPVMCALYKPRDRTKKIKEKGRKWRDGEKVK